MKPETRNSKLQTFCVFLFLVALYLAFSGDRYDDFQASDEWVIFQTTRALVERGSLRPELDERYRGQEAKYGLGQSLAAVPLYLLARALMPLLPERVSPAAVAFPLACATNALICAAIGALFFALARRLGYGRRPAIAGALIVGTTTIVAAYSKSFFSEPLVALSLLGAAGALVGPLDRPPSPSCTGNMPVLPGRWFRVGAWLAMAILTRLDNVVIVPVFLAGLWLGVGSPKDRQDACSTGRREALGGTALFALPLLLSALFILWTNYLRSGRFQLSGYGGETFSTSFLSGLFGLLFSPSHGVFWFSPPLAMALAYVVHFHRRHSRLCFVIFATVAVKLFVFAKWWNWFGGWSWGSRFLLPIVPLAMLALLEPLSQWNQLRRTERTLIGAVCAAGLLIQLCGLLVASNALHGNIQFLAGAGSGRVQPIADREQLLIFSPPQSPLIGNWPIIAHGRLDWFGLRFGQYFPSHLLVAIFAVLGVALIISVWGLVRAWFAERRESQISQIPEIQCKPEPSKQTAVETALPSVVWGAAALLVFLNIAALTTLTIAIRGNGLWRTDRVQYYDGRKEETQKRVGAVYLDDTIAGPAVLCDRSTEWLGYLEIPVSGTYSFYTVAVGAFEFHLGGQAVLTNTLAGGRRSQRADVDLERGLHSFRLSYTPATEVGAGTNLWQRQMQLYWTIPGGGEYEQVIGRPWFCPTMPGQFRRMLMVAYRLKVGFVIVSLLILWWIWLHSSLRSTVADPPRHW